MHDKYMWYTSVRGLLNTHNKLVYHRKARHRNFDVFS